MEQSYSSECHCHVVLVASHDNMIVPDRSARLGNVSHTALFSSLDVVTEWEESVRTKANACVLCKPFLLFSLSEHLRLYLECVLPYALSQYIIMLVRNVNVDSVISVRTSYVVNELKSQNLWMLSDPPDVSLVSCQSCAVYS